MDYEIELIARANAYQAFYLLLGGAPSAERLAAIDAPLVRESLSLCMEDADGERVASNLTQAVEAALAAPDEASRAYSRLFEGPGTPLAAPWESMYLSPHSWLFTEVTLAVRKFYKACGVQPASYPSVADDHIALEVGFLAAMASRAAQACPEGAAGEGDLSAEGRRALRASGEFLNTHLLRWAGQLADAVERGERKLGGGPYTATTRALCAFAHADSAWLGTAELAA